MTTYVYETISEKAGEEPRFLEIQQSMNDAPLTRHPKTGEPIRRVILGGYGLMKNDPGDGGNACGPSCGCH
ncbi:MAG: zinc ribbon domain-containing protein [Opitutales bacterium]